MNAKAVARRFDIDWLRVLLIVTVFFFHNARFYNDRSWHVFNAQISLAAAAFIAFLCPIMMPGIFMLSAAAITLTLGRKGIGRFIWDKVKRLLIPLVVGIFTTSPLMVYWERVTHGQFQGSFWQFFPHYFDGLYLFGGNFAWMGLHLWYLEVLFLYTLIFLPLFLALKTYWGQRVVRALGWFFSQPGLIYLLALLLALPMWFISEDSPLGSRDTGGNGLVTYMVYFVIGYLFFADERIQQSAIRTRYISLAAALLLTVPFLYGGYNDSAYILSPGVSMDGFTEPFFAWTWLLAILGFGMKYLTMGNRFLSYANEAVLPFYILHQPVILAVGFYLIIPLALPVAAKYAIIAVLSFAVIMALYEGLIRRVNLLRVLFGMKPLKRAPAVQPVTAPVA